MGERTRTLVVGPIGQRPWIPLTELVEDLEALDREVVVNGRPDHVLPTPRPLRPRLGTFVNSAPGIVAWLLRMLFRWRRSARRSLERAGINEVLVWDELLALLCRLARPRGVKVVWVVGPPEGTRFYQRAMRAAVARSADAVVTSWHGEKRFAGAHETVVAMPVPPAGANGSVEGWVVFGSHHELSDASVELLRRRAADTPALALVFSARTQDRVTPTQLERLCAASPRAVWWTAGDEWVTRMGGIPTAAIDPSDDFEVDHRHLRVLGAGGTVLVAPNNTRGLWTQMATAATHPSGWKRLALRPDLEVVDNDHAWAARAFGGRS